jgi:SAM-dependent methyltransferase
MKGATFHESRHLVESEVYPSIDRCPVCHHTGDRELLFRIQSDPDIHMLRCTRCHACSASHLPRSEVLEAYYSDYYLKKDKRVTFKGVERFAKHILEMLNAGSLPERISILDYGGGDGTLALEIAYRLLSGGTSRMIEILVVDFQEPMESRDARIRISANPDMEAVEGPFDIVLASAVLEHIPEVNHVMKRLFAAVAPGGYFYARTPYIIPFKKFIPNLDLTYPAHVHDMGPSFWNRVIALFSLNARALASQPSIVESEFRSEPLRTFVAYVLKFPSFLETRLTGKFRKDMLWNLVGGWEILLEFFSQVEGYHLSSKSFFSKTVR